MSESIQTTVQPLPFWTSKQLYVFDASQRSPLRIALVAELAEARRQLPVGPRLRQLVAMVSSADDGQAQLPKPLLLAAELVDLLDHIDGQLDGQLDGQRVMSAPASRSAVRSAVRSPGLLLLAGRALCPDLQRGAGPGQQR